MSDRVPYIIYLGKFEHVIYSHISLHSSTVFYEVSPFEYLTYIDMDAVHVVAVSGRPGLGDEPVELLVLLVPLDRVEGVVTQVVIAL